MEQSAEQKLNIAIIDSGIDLGRKEWVGKEIICLNDCTDQIGHGTAVTSIISQCTPHAKLYLYNLFARTGRVEAAQLIETLEALRSYGHFDIIHMSCGIVACDEIDRLQDVIEKMTQSGTVFVAAYDNEGAVSYPAAFAHVIGVDWNALCPSGMHYIFVKNSPVNILGTGSLQRLPWLNGTFQYVAGSSFAAPYITSMVAKILERGVTDFEEILAYLEENADRVWEAQNTGYRHKTNPVRINKAVVYPFNKEIHAIAANQKTLPFSIRGIYEPSLFRHVGQRVSDILQYGNSGIVIESERKIDWTDDFDTVILGHTRVIASALSRDIISEMLERCIQYKKNIYCFDSLLSYEKQVARLDEKGCWAFSPKIDQTDVDKSYLGKLFKISTPVVGVFGTSPKQGKFTLQIALKNRMSQIGYRIGGLSSEPSAPLFGFDFTYPMGYESSVSISGSDAVQTVNRLMHEIDQKQYDLILVGSQSQTIPYNMGNIGHYPIAQNEFLLGSEPDAIVLCINPFDDVSYIQRTIGYLENYIDTKVVALSLYPANRTLLWSVQGDSPEILATEKLADRMKFYTDALRLPCFLLGDEGELERLIDHVTDFFA